MPDLAIKRISFFLGASGRTGVVVGVFESLGAAELLIILFVALPIWGVIDAALRPDSAWRTANQSKVVWVVLQIFLGFIGAIAYFLAVRPKVRRAQEDTGPTYSA
jgi:hypothetical protein